MPGKGPSRERRESDGARHRVRSGPGKRAGGLCGARGRAEIPAVALQIPQDGGGRRGEAEDPAATPDGSTAILPRRSRGSVSTAQDP